MEEGSSKVDLASPRKVKFAPKVCPRRITKSAENNTHVSADAEAAQTQDLLRRINEASGRGGSKAERKVAPVQVAFGYTNESNSLRIPYVGLGSGRSTSTLQDPMTDDGSQSLTEKKKKEYVEPWDYYSNYPITLPMRRPYSGNPELLDEKEFGEESLNVEYDENSVNPAAELDLKEESENAKMLFVQLPASLPLVKRSASARGKAVADCSNPYKSKDSSEKGCSLDELKPGFMGKMLVYKSGAIKLKLGDNIYDVSPGSDCIFPQHVAAINVKENKCCVVGELSKRAIVTPNIDSFLDSIDN